MLMRQFEKNAASLHHGLGRQATETESRNDSYEQNGDKVQKFEKKGNMGTVNKNNGINYSNRGTGFEENNSCEESDSEQDQHRNS